VQPPVEIIRTDRKTIIVIIKYQPTITRNATKPKINKLRMLLKLAFQLHIYNFNSQGGDIAIQFAAL